MTAERSFGPLTDEPEEAEYLAELVMLTETSHEYDRSLTEMARRRAELMVELKAYGWSNRQLADCLGVTKQAIGQLLRRQRGD